MATLLYDLSDLRRVLVGSFDEEELRTLCFDLKVDYDSLPGSGKAAKARELVTYCERYDVMQKLVESIQNVHPDVVPKDADKRGKYYIASGKPGGSVAESLHVNDIVGNSLELAEDFNQADIIIVDLDNPPPDWLKYFVEPQKQRPLVYIVFVAFDTDRQSRGLVELDGKNILHIIGSSYSEDQILVCKEPGELSIALKTSAMSVRKQFEGSSRLAMRA